MGRTACRLFAADGARLLATDLSECPDGLDATFVRADLAGHAGRADVIAACRRQLGGLDSIYCNHGLILRRAFEETSEDDWRRILGANLESVFFLLRAALPLLAGGSSVVLLGSATGLGAVPNMSAYSATRAAVAMLVRSLAVQLAGGGIRVNAIGPGLIDTPMPRGFVAGLPDPELAWNEMLEANLLHRAGRPEEVVSLGVHLLSTESSFTTGAVFAVDAGRLAT